MNMFFQNNLKRTTIGANIEEALVQSNKNLFQNFIFHTEKQKSLCIG
jgi:hypothetical protein